jgi:CheY-like chemotaxis protein
MRFPIDVVFLDRNLRVVKIAHDLPAWRTASDRRARSALELAAGEAAVRGIEIGDQLLVVWPNGELHDRVQRMKRNGADDAENGESGSRYHREPDVRRGVDPTRVLLTGSDRRFRSVAAALLSRRGCAVTLGDGPATVAELARRSEADVVVLDAGGSLTAAAREAAQLEALNPPVGVVVVGEEPEASLSALPVLEKWGSFDGLYSAIQLARAATSRGSLNGTR